MKTKERKALAKKIAQCELTIQKSEDKYEVQKAQDKIVELSGRVESMEDIVAIDEMVQEILEKENIS